MRTLDQFVGKTLAVIYLDGNTRRRITGTVIAIDDHTVTLRGDRDHVIARSAIVDEREVA